MSSCLWTMQYSRVAVTITECPLRRDATNGWLKNVMFVGGWIMTVCVQRRKVPTYGKLKMNSVLCKCGWDHE